MISCACRRSSFSSGSSAGRIRRLQNTKQVIIKHQTQTSSIVTIAGRSRRLQFDTKQISFFTKTSTYTSSTIASRRLQFPNISHHGTSIRIASTRSISSQNGKTSSPKSIKEIWKALKKTPLQYATIPAVAAFLGLSTNWMGVKMLFYPIEYTGTEWYRSSPFVPYGFLGWQGVVPCKTEKMASRLVHIVTDRLLTVEEAFGRMDAATLASLLQPLVEEELMKEPYGKVVVKILQPILPMLLTRVVANLQKEIEGILDLQSVVLEAFLRDKKVLVELFQKVCILVICVCVSICNSSHLL